MLQRIKDRRAGGHEEAERQQEALEEKDRGGGLREQRIRAGTADSAQISITRDALQAVTVTVSCCCCCCYCHLGCDIAIAVVLVVVYIIIIIYLFSYSGKTNCFSRI